MNKTATALCAITLAFPAYAGESHSINWMSTLEDIQATRSATPEDVSAKRLTYPAQLKGAPYHQEYLFNDEGTLKNILYYRSYSTAGNDCAHEYERMVSAYREEFGEPAAPTQVTGDSSNPEAVCESVGAGQLIMKTEWSIDKNSVLTLLLSTWKKTPYVGVSFTPKP
jgi:hypothetical protein